MPGRPHHTDKWHNCVEKVMGQGHDEQSASAICTASLQDAGEPIFEGAAAHSAEEKKMIDQVVVENARELQLRSALGTPRVEKWDGEDHLVIPVVALQEGVIQAMNAPTPEFVSEDVLIRSFNLWNGLPIVIDHPKTDKNQPIAARAREIRDKQAFGIIRNAEVRGKRLGMEVLVNPKRLVALGEEKFLSDLKSGAPIEVSVGVYARTVDENGTFEGRPYKTKWLEIMPDHLAFLPRGTGACSLAMGCGANRHAAHVYLVTASALVEDRLIDLVQTQPSRLTAVFSSLQGDALDVQMMAVQSAVMDVYQEKQNVEVSGPTAYPLQIFDDHVIIQTKDGETLSVPYSMKDGKAVLDQAKAKPVKQAWIAAAGSMVSCDMCDGTGQMVDAVSGKQHDCPMCAGTGEIRLAAMKVLSGARHSYSDRKLIQAVHDNSVSLGAECDATNAKMMSTPRTLRKIPPSELEKIPDADFAGKHRSYPIAIPGDVHDAAAAIGLSQGANNYSVETLKKNIIAIAKRKGPSFVAELPDSWKEELKAAAYSPIRHEGGKYILYSQDGTKKLGSHDTRAEAEAQMQAVEKAKQRRSAELARCAS